MEKCWKVAFELEATAQVMVGFVSPGGNDRFPGTWGLKTNLGYATGHMEKGGVYKLVLEQKWGRTEPTEVTISYRVVPPNDDYRRFNEC